MFNSSLFPPAAPKAAGRSAQCAKGCNNGCGIACMLCSCVSPSEKICSGHKICSAILSGLKRVWSFSLLLIAGAAANVALVVNFYCRYSGVSNENVPAHANVCGDHVAYHRSSSSSEGAGAAKHTSRPVCWDFSGSHVICSIFPQNCAHWCTYILGLLMP